MKITGCNSLILALGLVGSACDKPKTEKRQKSEMVNPQPPSHNLRDAALAWVSAEAAREELRDKYQKADDVESILAELLDLMQKDLELKKKLCPKSSDPESEAANSQDWVIFVDAETKIYQINCQKDGTFAPQKSEVNLSAELDLAFSEAGKMSELYPRILAIPALKGLNQKPELLSSYLQGTIYDDPALTERVKNLAGDAPLLIKVDRSHLIEVKINGTEVKAEYTELAPLVKAKADEPDPTAAMLEFGIMLRRSGYTTEEFKAVFTQSEDSIAMGGDTEVFLSSDFEDAADEESIDLGDPDLPDVDSQDENPAPGSLGKSEGSSDDSEFATFRFVKGQFMIGHGDQLAPLSSATTYQDLAELITLEPNQKALKNDLKPYGRIFSTETFAEDGSQVRLVSLVNSAQSTIGFESETLEARSERILSIASERRLSLRNAVEALLSPLDFGFGADQIIATLNTTANAERLKLALGKSLGNSALIILKGNLRISAKVSEAGIIFAQDSIDAKINLLLDSADFPIFAQGLFEYLGDSHLVTRDLKTINLRLAGMEHAKSKLEELTKVSTNAPFGEARELRFTIQKGAAALVSSQISTVSPLALINPDVD